MIAKRKFDLQFFADEPTDNGDGGKPDNKPDKTFTQSDVDRLVKDRLDRERKKYADYEDLKKAKDELDELKRGGMSELEKERQEKELLKAAKEAAENEVRALKTGSLKASLLTAAGLPLELAGRVQGSTEEEIKADIEEVKKLFKPASVGSASNPGAPKDESDDARGRRMAEERQKAKEAPKGGLDPWGAQKG